ncbi:MAG: hypothetical protein VKL98_09205 [Cyanobacteriota bacterium]|nr:hypothetical protein [Cyanobacteriota bacterium]
MQPLLSRRLFLLGTGSFTASLALSSGSIIPPARSQVTPGELGTGKAVAVKEGKILAVGRCDQVQSLAGPGTRVIDLGGKTLVPGFIDGHGHVLTPAPRLKGRLIDATEYWGSRVGYSQGSPGEMSQLSILVRLPQLPT